MTQVPQKMSLLAEYRRKRILFVIWVLVRDHKTWVLSQKRFCYFLEHLYFRVNGVELPLIFYTKKTRKMLGHMCFTC